MVFDHVVLCNVALCLGKRPTLIAADVALCHGYRPAGRRRQEKQSARVCAPSWRLSRGLLRSEGGSGGSCGTQPLCSNGKAATASTYPLWSGISHAGLWVFTPQLQSWHSSKSRRPPFLGFAKLASLLPGFQSLPSSHDPGRSIHTMTTYLLETHPASPVVHSSITTSSIGSMPSKRSGWGTRIMSSHNTVHSILFKRGCARAAKISRCKLTAITRIQNGSKSAQIHIICSLNDKLGVTPNFIVACMTN